MTVEGGLRRPFFIIALALMVLVIMVELGAALIAAGSVQPGTATANGLGMPAGVAVESGSGRADSLGAGVGSLALLDGLLLFTLLLLGASLVMPLRLYGRIQGLVTLIVCALWILLCFLTILQAVVKLFLMIALFVAMPFGTIAYMALWGSFPIHRAALVLGLLLLLKIAVGVLLILAQPRFLRIKGLVVLVVLSVLLQLVLGIIHGFLPGPVVSIGDQFWAIVVGVVALIWALIMLIWSIPAIVNAIRVSASFTDSQPADSL